MGNFFSDTGSAIARGTQNVVQGGVDLAQQAGGAIAQGTQNVVQGTQNVVQGGVNLAQQAGGAIAQGTQNVVQGGVNLAQQAGGAIAQETRSLIQGAQQAGTEFVQGAQGLGSDLLQGAQDFGRSVQDVAQQGTQLFKDFVHQADPTDGQFMGAGGKLYPPGTPLNQMDPVRPDPNNPNAAPPTGENIYYVNGMNTPADYQAGTSQMIADQTGANVINIRNGTNGTASDIVQCVGDMFDVDQFGPNSVNNGATDTLSDAMYQHAMSGQEMNVVAHSQGGLITDNAVEQTKQRMVSEGMPPEEAERRMGVVNVRTYGAASPGYEPGPNYEHTAHPDDHIAQGSGVANPIVGNDQRGHGNPVHVEYGPNGEGGHDMRSYVPSMRPRDYA